MHSYCGPRCSHWRKVAGCADHFTHKFTNCPAQNLCDRRDRGAAILWPAHCVRRALESARERMDTQSTPHSAVLWVSDWHACPKTLGKRTPCPAVPIFPRLGPVFSPFLFAHALTICPDVKYKTQNTHTHAHAAWHTRNSALFPSDFLFTICKHQKSKPDALMRPCSCRPCQGRRTQLCTHQLS